MACWKVLVTVLVFFLQSLPLLVSVEANRTASLPLTNITEAKVRCIESERNGLLRFKKSLTDPSDRLASWIGKECCIWKGVSCDIQTGNVISLDLKDTSGNCYQKKKGYLISGNSSCLGGKISPALLDLQHLEHLDLGGNDFQGLATPTFLGSLEKLQYLNLSRSSLVGIPPSFGNLSNLRYLSLGAYSYPYTTVERSWIKDLNWVSGLSSLKYLDLSYLNLSSATHWLESFNKLPSLVTLSLQDCNLHHLPYSFPNWNMTSLSYLYLSRNNFVNPVLPKWLSNATTLETLDIAINNIEGPISNVEWGKFCNLRDLYLTQNKLHGDISGVVEGLSGCSNTTLEFLGLAGNRLTGQFPNSLGHLKNLRMISISFNQISGTIPTSIEQLSKLEILDLGQNQLKGALPESIFNLTELTQLFLATNDWEGNLTQNDFARLHQLKFLAISCGERFAVKLSSEWIPPFSLTYIEIRKCGLGSKLPTWLKTQKQLRTITLSNDSISDPIPLWLWTMCSQLQFLDLSGNEIGGNLPRLVNFPSSQIRTVDFYSSYSDGVVVDLSSNSFHGLLPLWPNVTHLNLANNLFSGLIPINIGHVMSKLQVIDLSGNTFTGSIPYSITRVKQLMRLDLSENHLSGKIPDWWDDLQQLHVIDLSGNNLSGGIPPSLCSSPSLFWLRLSRNNLIGELPKSLSNCKSLLTLDIGENKINGTIPEWFGESVLSLQKLSMTDNMIGGHIPPQLCQLFDLQILDLSHNNLTGSIPSCLGNLRGLKSVKFYKWHPNYYYFNYVFTPKMVLIKKGTRMTYTSTLDQVNLIDLSFNNLHGEIPDEITGLSALGTLNLSWNQLSGGIPEDIGSMQQLETLDLSSNHLSGSIPLSMTSITTLSYLNLSYNNLGGPIPSKNQFGTFINPSSFEGNPELSGKPLITDCSPPRKREMNEKIEDDDDDERQWFLMSAGIGFVVTFLVTFSSLTIKESWGYSYFNFVEELGESIIRIFTLNIVHVMTKLKVLDLSGNAFTGSIPYCITRVKQLLRLDLSDNHLPGKIPDWWYKSQLATTSLLWLT
ncbi:receptor-like protein EIX2 [Solanum dulcamara]|uniref:receptor-like protein EIX2 n=1 Tax=Solanum dulcamara TaxID=45834 RepID=UPI0024869F87|nr:receptor-like protein EIX2 [Solanum dulcamara]